MRSAAAMLVLLMTLVPQTGAADGCVGVDMASSTGGWAAVDPDIFGEYRQAEREHDRAHVARLAKGGLIVELPVGRKVCLLAAVADSDWEITLYGDDRHYWVAGKALAIETPAAGKKP